MKKRIVIVLLSLMTLIVALPGGAERAAVTETITIDVACDGRTFAINRQNPSSQAIRRGDTFVLNGAIFPGGTIPAGGTRQEPSSFGPDQPGSTGTWFAQGTFLVGSQKFDVEKIQRVSTHYFALSGKNRIITEGFEGSAETTRVILGGVNEYAGKRGLVSMERLGTNLTGAYNLRFTFELQ